MIANEPTKTVSPAPTRPLLPSWIAYVAAGLTFVSAAYLWTSIPTFLALYADLGIEVPALVHLQLSFPRLLPLGMVAAGILVLLGTRHETTVKRGRSARSLAGTAAVGLTLFSILMVFMNTITIRSLQRGSSQEQSTQDHLDRKLAWAKNLPQAPAATSYQPPKRRQPIDLTYMHFFNNWTLKFSVEVLGKRLQRVVEVAPEVAERQVSAAFQWHAIRVEVAADILTRIAGSRLERRPDTSWGVLPRSLPPLPKGLLVSASAKRKTLPWVIARLGYPVTLKVDSTVERAELSLRTTKLPYWEVLWILTRMTGTELAFDPNTQAYTIFRPAPGADRASALLPTTFVDLRLRGLRLREGLVHLQQVTGLKVDCDADTQATMIPADLERVPRAAAPWILAEVLSLRLRRGPKGALHLTR